MKVLREMPLVDSFDEKVVCSNGDVLNVIGHCSVKDLNVPDPPDAFFLQPVKEEWISEAWNGNHRVLMN